MTDVQEWLDSRTPAPPPALRTQMTAALTAVAASDAGGIAARLGEASLHALRVALENCDERSSAPDLLAADALLTYAMEAAAEIGGDAVLAVADAYGGARLAQLLTEVA